MLPWAVIAVTTAIAGATPTHYAWLTGSDYGYYVYDGPYHSIDSTGQQYQHARYNNIKLEKAGGEWRITGGDIVFRNPANTSTPPLQGWIWDNDGRARDNMRVHYSVSPPAMVTIDTSATVPGLDGVYTLQTQTHLGMPVYSNTKGQIWVQEISR
jgi:hypothetical protein